MLVILCQIPLFTLLFYILAPAYSKYTFLNPIKSQKEEDPTMIHVQRSAIYLALLILILVMAACQTPALPSTTVDQPGTGGEESVTMAFWTRDSNQAQVRQLVDAWNESHENQIELTVIPASEYITKVGASVAAGSAPDIIAVDLIYVPQFAAANQLVDISEWARALPYFESLSPSHVRLATYEGNIYALPFNAEGSILLWNKDLFRQAGLDPESPPTSWAEIAAAAEQITALGDDIYGFYFAGSCAGCNAFTFMPLIWASDGDVLSDDGQTATLTDSPEVTEALQFYRQLWENGDIPPGAQADTGTDFFNAFTSGKIGMAGSGAFSISRMKNEFPDIDFGVTYLPGNEGGRSSFAGGDSIGIPAGSQYADQAFEFIEWVTSDEVQLEYYAAANSLPVRTDLAENEYFAEDPRLTTAANAMALGRTPYSIVYNQLFNDANGPWLKMIQTAVFDGNIEGAVEQAQEEFTTILQGQ
jgi:multiple sugar transport system substrate-binding protein